VVESCKIVFLAGAVHIHLIRHFLQDVSFSHNAVSQTDGQTGNIMTPIANLRLAYLQ